MIKNGTPPHRNNLPLNALRAFEAAARHLSIKDAALELNVTASAVSHQLRGLEEALGLALMRRSGSTLVLTEAGQKLSPKLTEGFSQIADAVGGLRHERSAGPLRLTVLPTFAAYWLLPRMAGFLVEAPTFEVLITTAQVPVDLQAGGADVAIRHGRGGWDALHAEHMFDEHVGLLGVGKLGALGEGEARRLAGARTLFLSQNRENDFANWNDMLPSGPVSVRRVVLVDTTGLALKAALDDGGIAFAGLEMASAELEAGRLQLLFDHRVATGYGYYLVYPFDLARDRRVQRLRRWLLHPSTMAPPTRSDEV